MGKTVTISTKKGIDLAEFLREKLCEYVSKHFEEAEGMEALVIGYGVDIFYINWVLHQVNILKKEDVSLEEAIDFKFSNLKQLLLFNVEDKKATAH